MKKLLTFITLTLALICLLASCGGQKDEHTHEFGEWDVTEKPTCSEKGIKTRYCSCGEKQIDVIYATSHKEEILPAKEATCVSTGLTEGKRCFDCGEILLAQTETAMLSHTFGDWVTVKEPTTTEEGLQERTCACGEKETQKISKRPVTYSKGLGFTLNDDDQSYTVTGRGTCTDTDVFISNTYEGLPVTSIGDFAFDGCTGLTSIMIPDSVKSIGEKAFSGCTGLTSIVIGDSVTSIGYMAFYNCTDLTSIVIPNSVTSIGSWAFSYCIGLTSIVIPDSVTSIGSSAFYNCTGLTSIVIPDSVETIGENAFKYCSNLSEITLGESLRAIESYAFAGCTGLTSITVDEDNTSYQSIDGNLYSKDGKTLIQYAIGKKNTSFTIPDSVTSIGEGAFWYCTVLTSIVIPDSVTSIGDSAFWGCTGFTSIVIPDSVTSIDSAAFYACKSLTDVYYTGTEAEWAKISIGSYNSYLKNATKHYNYVPAN